MSYLGRFISRCSNFVSRRYTDWYIQSRPIEKTKIVFDNFFGKGYGENPKYIAEEIHRQRLDWDLVWLVRDQETEVPSYLRTVIYGSNAAMRELSTAKVVINNVRNSMRVPKKNGQIYVQTWHGGIGSKRCEGEIADALDPRYIEQAKKDGEECDAIISSCAWQTKLFKIYFWLNEKTTILEIGLPRCDILLQYDTKAVSEEVRNKMKLPNDCGIILYAPTFRDDGSTTGYALDYKAALDAFEKILGKKCVFIVRLHPNASHFCSQIEYDSQIVNGSLYPDIQQLYSAADVLITDYSSAAFDFSLLGKPVFLCMLDLQEYMHSRGLNDVFEECPFPKSETNEGLIESILSFDAKEYHEKMRQFMNNYWKPFDDGHAAQKAVDWLRDQIE